MGCQKTLHWLYLFRASCALSPVAGVGAALLAELTGHGVVNPADTLGHRGIDTRWLPPSPLQVSLPSTPPAQINESSSWNLLPSLVVLREASHWSWPTTGRSISLRTTW